MTKKDPLEKHAAMKEIAIAIKTLLVRSVPSVKKSIMDFPIVKVSV